MISKLQYITSGKSSEDHLDQIKLACKAGVKWIQLRLKKAGNDEYLFYACEARKITKMNNAILIINDNLLVAIKSAADGIHLGKEDISPKSAREITKGRMIIGGTANTIEDVNYLKNENVDYIGLGPYKHTTTKKNLSPVLGASGISTIVDQAKALKIPIPIIAIGGIELDDIELLMKANVYGIAVSSLISNAKNKEKIILEIENKIISKKHQTI